MGNSGYTGTSMQGISRQDAEMQDAEFKKNKGVRKLYCPYCGEEFIMSAAEYSSDDALLLENHLRANKCSYCKPATFQEYLGVTVKHEQMLSNGKVLYYIRPSLYKKSKCLSYAEQKAKDSRSFRAKASK